MPLYSPAGVPADGTITSAKIADGSIVNADVNASAAIAYSKLNLASSLVSADITDGTVALGDLATATKADWEYAYSGYKHLLHASYVAGTAVAAGTYAMLLNGTSGAITFTNATNSGTAAFYVDPADYAAGSRTVKYRIVVSVVTNTVAPAINYTVGLYPVATAAGGGNGIVGMTVGSVTTGSTVLFTTPAATSLNTANSTDFAAPTAGYYALGIVTSGTQATNATAAIHAILQMRQV